MKIKYRVLVGASMQSLEQQVDDLANNEGYIAQGGVAVGRDNSDNIFFAQAMILDESK